ncbi:hypothetical protein ABZ896_17010 [Streptomyces sp. NPDC047072]|uniref:hypothetical protein n=1 Tax=Streptomyces sp. NPDC047072 TaxID=3154809 RepID=UPI0033CB1C8D
MIEHVRKVFMGLDIAGFNRAGRSDLCGLGMRQTLYRALEGALLDIAVQRDEYELLDRGDGIMAVLDPLVDLDTLAYLVLPALAAGLRNHNATADAQDIIRVRAALHKGDVIRDDRGYVGKELSHAFRLLDSPQLRTALEQSGTELALAVSAVAWRQMRHAGSGGPHFEPALVTTKERAVRAWLADVAPSASLVR